MTDPDDPIHAQAREILEANGLHPGDDTGKDRGPSQASQLVALARERYDLFMSEDGRPYGVTHQGANIALPLRGKATGLRSQLARIYTDTNRGAVPSQGALTDAMTVLEGIAQAADPRTPQLRVARHGDGIVVDLGTADGRCVVVHPGGWERCARSPVLFRRSGAMKPLPEPLRDGDGLEKLRDLLNTSEEGFRLLVAWLVACFIPDLPHPILTFRGEQGTGKSYAAKMVIGLVDPSGAPKRTMPRDLRAWSIQASNSWALCLDNVSIIPDWMSDALCRAVTGDGVVERALYTDDDVVVMEFRRVLAMTTIDAGALAGDLAERLLMIELRLIPDSRRREEADLDAAYTAAHAAILASLFDLLAAVLKALPHVHLSERPRMADFARILAAVDHVTGWDTLGYYKATARDAIADVLEGEPFAQAVVSLVDQAGPEGITLTAAELLVRVPVPDRLPKKWPKDPTRAGGQLKRLAPALRAIGIEVDDSKRGPKPKKQRLYTITASRERRHETASPASPAASCSALTSGNRGDADAGTPASPLAGRGDANRLRGDTGRLAASPGTTASDQRISFRGDAGDAGDAELHLLSDAVSAPFSVTIGVETHRSAAHEPMSTGQQHTPRHAGAGAGAGPDAAPAPETTPELGEYTRAGAAGADLHALSNPDTHSSHSRATVGDEGGHVPAPSVWSTGLSGIPAPHSRTRHIAAPTQADGTTDDGTNDHAGASQPRPQRPSGATTVALLPGLPRLCAACGEPMIPLLEPGQTTHPTC